MHAAAYDFVRAQVLEHGPYSRVIEIGSRNINGTFRPLFVHQFGAPTSYTGLDLIEGPDVDEVTDALDYTPDTPVDCVVCCEVLEHTPNWRALIAHAATWLTPAGSLIITCAAPNRAPHSAIDGDQLRPGEHYEAPTLTELQEALDDAGLLSTVTHTGTDLHAHARPA